MPNYAFSNSVGNSTCNSNADFSAKLLSNVSDFAGTGIFQTAPSNTITCSGRAVTMAQAAGSLTAQAGGYVIPFSSAVESFTNTTIISNRSEGGEGQYVFVYDHNMESSTALHSYGDPETDNGGCVAVVNTGKPITIIFSEDLSVTNLVKKDCDINSYTLFNPYTSAGCPILTDSPIVFGASYYSDNSIVFTPPQVANGDRKPTPIPISFICQDVGGYLINNFNDYTVNKNPQIVEYASSNPNNMSYCSVTFTPKQVDQKIGIKAGLLNAGNKSLQRVCNISDYDKVANCSLDTGGNTNELQCTFDTRNITSIVNPNTQMTTVSGDILSCSGMTPFTCTQNNNQYSCITTGLPQNYTCNFIVDINNNITDAFCSMAVDLVVVNPQLQPENDFSCGFCTAAETNTVGGNTNTAFFETNYGAPGNNGLFPFTTKSATAPLCASGIISYLGLASGAE